MENYINKITQYLPKMEEFLTSILLEETKVTVTESGTINTLENLNALSEEDIYLIAYDELTPGDFIIVLDKAWFALLSSIMLGVEERTWNEVTKDLLGKFTSELKTTFTGVLSADGIVFEVKNFEATQHKKLEGLLHHTEYLQLRLEVEGLADENVQAAILVGKPEALIKQEEPVEEKTTENDNPDQNGFRETTIDDIQNGTTEQAVSGTYVEFEDFGDDTIDFSTEDGKSMEMLRDVEMEVSVELGRIKMPLGKVLQLAKGSVIELDKLAGEPVDILVNGQHIAQGEVVVIDEHFGVRISNLITTRQHLVKIN
jgi:flagellar motor switch protein FliN/FliY